MQQFCSPTFYGAPVMLEQVGDAVILGCEVDPPRRACRYIVPAHAWQFRSASSAGSSKLNLSGLRSRAALAARQSFPCESKHAALLQLSSAYTALGFPENLVKQALKRWW